MGRDGFVFFFFLLHCKPAYSEPVSGPEIGTVAVLRKGTWHKNTFGSMAGLTLTLICVAASGHTVRGVSERGPAINQEN